MCTQVIVGNVDPQMPTWDRPNVTIIVSRSLDAITALAQVRTLLAVLGATHFGLAPTCWCGEPVDMPHFAAWTPRQYTPVHYEEARRGA